jgi:hypothetical protein
MVRHNKYSGKSTGTVSIGGRVLNKTEVVALCGRCQKDFTCVMTTRPPVYCPECREIVRSEKIARDKERVRNMRAEPAKQERRLIRYAGYDKGE